MVVDGKQPSANLADAHEPDFRAWFTLAVLTCCAVLAYTSQLSINIFVDPIKTDMAINDVQISLLQGAAFIVPVFFSGILSGFLADRISRRLILAGGLTLWALATIASGLAQDYGELIVARALLGLGKGSLVPVAVTLVTQSFPAAKRGRALGIFFIGVSIGPGAGIALAGLVYESVQSAQLVTTGVLAQIPPWRIVFFVLACPAALILAALFCIADPADQLSEGPQSADTGRPGASLLYLAIFTGLIVVSFTDNAAIGWIPAVFSREFGYSVAEAGSVFATVAIAGGCVGPILGGWASDRIYHRWGAGGRLAACSAAAGLLSLLYLSFLLTTPMILTICLLLIAILITSIGTVGMVVIQELLPDRLRGLGTGLTYSFGMLIAGNGPTVVAMVNEWAYSAQSTSLAITTVCFPSALFAALCLALAVSLHRATDSPDALAANFQRVHRT